MSITCRPTAPYIAAAALLLLLSVLDVLVVARASGVAGLVIAGAVVLSSIAGAYYILTSARWMSRGLEEVCSLCGDPKLHPWIQAASCRRGDRVICYSNVTRTLYIAEGSIEEARPVRGMHCVWALDARVDGDSYRGVFLARGGGTYRVDGVLRYRRIQP